MKKQTIEVGELKVGDRFTDIAAGSNTKDREYVVTWNGGDGEVEAHPVDDKNEEEFATFLSGETVEIITK